MISFDSCDCRCDAVRIVVPLPEWWPPGFGDDWGVPIVGQRKFEWGYRVDAAGLHRPFMFRIRPRNLSLEDVEIWPLTDGRGYHELVPYLEGDAQIDRNGGFFQLTVFDSAAGESRSTEIRQTIAGLTSPTLPLAIGEQIIQAPGIWPDLLPGSPSPGLMPNVGMRTRAGGRTAEGLCGPWSIRMNVDAPVYGDSSRMVAFRMVM